MQKQGKRSAGEKSLGKNLAKLRKQYGYKQTELAEKLNVSQQIISNIENSKSAPDIELLIQTADIYGITLDQLVGREFVGKEGSDGLQQRIINCLNGMDEKGRKLVLELLKVVQNQGNDDGSKQLF